MRPSTGIYILVIAAAFGLSTVLTRTFAPNDNLVGQTLASDTTRALAEDDPPRRISFVYLGEHVLKGFGRPARLWEVVSEQAGVQPRGAARPEATGEPFPGRADELAAAAAAALSRPSGRDSLPE